MLLCSQIRPQSVAHYDMQEDTIFCWLQENANDHANPQEVALSFAHAEECLEFARRVHSIERNIQPLDNDPNLLVTSQTPHDSNNHSAPFPSSSLALPLSVSSPQHDHDMLRSPEHTMSTALEPETIPNHTNVPTSNHVSLVDAAAAADIGNATRIFSEPLDNSQPWNPDAIDDSLFRETGSGFLLATSPSSAGTEVMAGSAFSVPDPNRAGVEALSRLLGENNMYHLPNVRQKIINAVLKPDYIKKFCEVFRHCEKSADFAGLSALHHVVRRLFMIGSRDVLEVLVRDDNLIDIVGCMEYNPDHIANLEKRFAEEKSAMDAASVPKQKPIDNTQGSDSNPSKRSADLNRTEKSDMQDHKSEEKHQSSSPERGARENASNPSTHGGSNEKECVGKNAEDSASSENKMHSDTTSMKKDSGEVRGENPGKDIPDTTVTLESTAEADVIVPVAGKMQIGEESGSSGNVNAPGRDGRYIVRFHRDFLERTVAFVPVVPINDPVVLSKIHQNYRVQYIKDVILIRLFDESLNASLSSVILCNNVDIIRYFISGSSALQNLFLRMKSAVKKRRGMKRRSLEGLQAPPETKKHQTESTSATEQCAKRSDASGDTADHAKDQSENKDAEKALEDDPTRAREPTVSSQSPKSSSNSGVSVATGDSNATMPENPTGDKEASSTGEETENPDLRERARVGNGNSENAEEAQQDLSSMLGFLRELCSLVKGQQPTVRDRFHTILRDLGILEVAVDVIRDEDPKIRALCSEVLTSAILHNPKDAWTHLRDRVFGPDRRSPRRMGIPLRSAPLTAVVPSSSRQVLETGMAMDIEPSSDKAGSCETGTGEKEKNSQDESKDRDRKEKSQNAEIPGMGLPVSVKEFGKRSDDKMEDVQNSNVKIEKAHGNGEKGWTVSKRPRAGNCEKAVEHRSNKREKMDNGLGPYPLLGAMIEAVSEDKASGTALTILDMLRTLVDPSPMWMEKEGFLDDFYEHYLHRLIKCMERCDEEERKRKEEGVECGYDFNAAHACDLLAFCIKSHGSRGKGFVQNCDVFKRVDGLFRHRRVHIRLSALRLIRACVGLKDDEVDREMIGTRIFGTMMEMFEKNGTRDNLVSSAVLEVVQMVTVQKRFDILKLLVEEYEDILKKSSKYCRAFSNAKKKYEEMEMCRKCGKVESDGGCGGGGNGEVFRGGDYIDLRANEQAEFGSEQLRFGIRGNGDGLGHENIRRSFGMGSGVQDDGYFERGGDMEMLGPLMSVEQVGNVNMEQGKMEVSDGRNSWVVGEASGSRREMKEGVVGKRKCGIESGVVAVNDEVSGTNVKEKGVVDDDEHGKSESNLHRRKRVENGVEKGEGKENVNGSVSGGGQLSMSKTGGIDGTVVRVEGGGDSGGDVEEWSEDSDGIGRREGGEAEEKGKGKSGGLETSTKDVKDGKVLGRRRRESEDDVDTELESPPRRRRVSE